MDRPTGLGNLQTGQWDQLQEYADRFEDAWQKVANPNDGPDIKAFLPATEDALRPVALHELIKTDLEIRWRRGQTIGLERYVEKYPELGSVQSLQAPLIYEEYRVRQLYGDKPQVGSYQVRFPEQYQQFYKLIQQQPLPTVVTATPTPAEVSPTAAAASPPSPAPVVPTLTGAPAAPPGQAPTLAASPATAPTGALPPIPGYKWVKRIGSGGFGEVWRAEAPGGVECAIKVIFRPLDHDEAKRELQSLELIKSLRHPYLLQTQLYMPLEDRLFIVMELAEGSLRDRLKECRNLSPQGIPIAELLNYFREAAEALDYLHQKRVLHRDIKPDNILMLQRHAKVADFGLARVTQASMATASGSGTPAYMAPEVWRGKVSDKSDQYALAVTYAELRLDRRLFTSRDMMEVMLDHLERTPDLSPLAEAEQQVILKAMAKEPSKRFPTCGDFVEALIDAVGPLAGRTGRARGLGSLATVPEAGQPAPSMGTEKLTAPLPGAAAGLLETLGTGAVAGAGSQTHPATAPEVPPKKSWHSSATQPLITTPPKRRKLVPVIGTVVVVLFAIVGAFVGQKLIQNGGTKPSSGPKPEEKPSEKDVFLPDNCVEGDGAKVVTIQGVKLYDRIDFVLLTDGTHIPFILVPRKKRSDPPTFYIMRDKVTNELFRKLGVAGAKSEWQLGALADGKDVTNKDNRLPVFRVTVDEANAFARHLGGYLPSGHEWDKAAGLYDHDKKSNGPFQEPLPRAAAAGQPPIAIGRDKSGPVPAGTATHDESMFGCRDMAGNGRELTRTLSLEEGKEVPVKNPPPDLEVTLRGRSYASAKPLTYYEMERDTYKEVQLYEQASPYTSFRVVIELSPIQ